MEAAAKEEAVLLRSSVDPNGSTLAVTRAAWRDLTARIKSENWAGPAVEIDGRAGHVGGAV